MNGWARYVLLGACVALLATGASSAEGHDHAGEGAWTPATGGPRLGFGAAEILGAPAPVDARPSTGLLILRQQFATPRERRVLRELRSTAPEGRPGVVHRSGRVVDGAHAPTVRVASTRDTAAEPTLGVTSDGTLFFVGVGYDFGTGWSSRVQRSSDGGKTWQRRDPFGEDQAHAQKSLDPFLYVDKRTDRLFNVDYTGCSKVSFSDDRGETYRHSSVCQHTDHQNVFAGPAPAGSPQPKDYENAVYYCAIDAGAFTNFSAATGCSRSLDGGNTWVRTLTLPFTDDPSRTEGQMGVPGHCGGATGHGVVGPDGTVYLPRGYCGQPYVAISRDEGDTWERVQVADIGVSVGPGFVEEHEASVAVDAAGTVYYAWQARDRLPYLVVSKDAGATWSEPVLISPPGVQEGWDPFLDAGDPGRIAVSYMGTVNSPGPPYCVTTVGVSEWIGRNCYDAEGNPGRLPDEWEQTRWTGYMAVSVDAASATPTFHTAPVGTFEDPLHVGQCGVVSCGPVVDFLDIVLGPDGVARASFVDACTAQGDRPRCVDPGIGVVAELRDAPRATGPLPPAGTPAPGAPAPGVTPGPPAGTCGGGRVTVRLSRTLRSARVRLGRRRFEVRRRSGRLIATAPAFGLPRGTVRVHITGRGRSGRRVRIVRRVRTCR